MAEPVSSALSKNQQKKLKRQAEWEAKADERKAFRKKKREIRKNNKKERKLAEKEANANNTESSETLECKKVRFPDQEDAGISVIIDLDFVSYMRNLMKLTRVEKELPSVVTQVGRCYTANRTFQKRVSLSVTSFNDVWKQLTLKKFPDYDKWRTDNIVFSEEDILEVDEKKKICYLTADSQNTVTSFSKDTIYVIGGIVDRNRHKNLCLNKAEKLNFETGKLPIDDFVEMSTRKVVTINQVFEIIIEFINNGENWKDAFFKVIRNLKPNT